MGPKAKSALSALSLPIIGADGALLGHVAYDTVMNAPWIVPDTPGDSSGSAGGGGPARGGACCFALLLCRRFASSQGGVLAHVCAFVNAASVRAHLPSFIVPNPRPCMVQMDLAVGPWACPPTDPW